MKRLLVVWRLVATLHLVFLITWLVQVVVHQDPSGDWWDYREAAIRWFDGAGAALYVPDFEHEPAYRFIYPPYTLYLFLPLAAVSESVAYALIASVQLAAVLAAVWLLIREVDPDPDTRSAVLLGFFASAAFTWEVILGQTGGGFLLSYTLALLAWRRGRSSRAGLALSILGIKPHWTVAPALLLAGFDRRAWLAFALAGVGLVVASLPLGIELWQGFLDAATGQVDLVNTHLGHERHNLAVRGFLVAQDLSLPWLRAAWWAVVVPASVALIAVWRAPVDPLRKISALILFTVSTNYYVNIYDSVVLLIPVLDWTSGPDRLPISWSRAGSVAIVVAWLWDARTWLWPVFLPVDPGPFCLSGIVSVGLLLAHGIHALRMSAAEPA